MLDLIYSSSILIDSCRCLPGQKKKKIIIFSSLVEKKLICFLKMKTLRKTPDFPRCSSKRKKGGTSIRLPLFECPSRWHFCFSLISMHHNGFTKSFACCLSCESCLCAQCQMPGQGRGDVGMGRWPGGGEGGRGGRAPVCPALKLPYIHGDRVLNSAPNTPAPYPLCSAPPEGRVEPGKNNLLFDRVFKIKKNTIIIIMTKREKKQLL